MQEPRERFLGEERADKTDYSLQNLALCHLIIAPAAKRRCGDPWATLCDFLNSVYIRALAAGETTSCIVFYIPVKAKIEKLAPKLEAFIAAIKKCGDEQTLLWVNGPNSPAKINLTSLAGYMHMFQLPSGLYNSFRGVAAIISYLSSEVPKGTARPIHMPSDDYAAVVPFGRYVLKWLVFKHYDVHVPAGHPGNPEPGKELQLTIYFISTFYMS